MSDDKTPMRIVTQRDLIRGVAAKWRGQYQYAIENPEKDARWHTGETKASIWAALKALDLETATADDVRRIIGNDSWTSLRCDECGTETEQVLMFGTSGYESSTHSLCAKCVHAAFALWETRS